MESFDFNALDSEALDQTLAFLNAYNIAPSLDPIINDFEPFNEPAMQWPLADNLHWSSLINADSCNVLPNSLTDDFVPGADFSGLEYSLQDWARQPHQVMSPEAIGQSR